MESSGYPLLNLFWTMLILFCFAVWFWLLILIFSDLFRRDMSGWAKAGWTVFVIVFSYIGVLAYLVTQGREMVERRQGKTALSPGRDAEMRAAMADGAQPVDQIAGAKALLDSGAITTEEYEVLKQKVLGHAAPSAAAR
jgi:uncharacterized membrane protein YcjF (UPF0283 family)